MCTMLCNIPITKSISFINLKCLENELITCTNTRPRKLGDQWHCDCTTCDSKYTIYYLIWYNRWVTSRQLFVSEVYVWSTWSLIKGACIVQSINNTLVFDLVSGYLAAVMVCGNVSVYYLLITSGYGTPCARPCCLCFVYCIVYIYYWIYDILERATLQRKLCFWTVFY